MSCEVVHLLNLKQNVPYKTMWGSDLTSKYMMTVFEAIVGGSEHSRALKLIGKSKQKNPDLSDFLLMVGVLVWGILGYFGVI